MFSAETRSLEWWRELVHNTALRIMRMPLSQRSQPVSLVEHGIETRQLSSFEAQDWMTRLGHPRLSLLQRSSTGLGTAQVTLVVLTRPDPFINPNAEYVPGELRQGSLGLGQMTFLLEIGRSFLQRLLQFYEADLQPPQIFPGSFFELPPSPSAVEDCLVAAVPFELSRVCAGFLYIIAQNNAGGKAGLGDDWLRPSRTKRAAAR